MAPHAVAGQDQEEQIHSGVEVMQGIERSSGPLDLDQAASTIDMSGHDDPQDVYRSDLMEVRKTVHAGMGVFATAHIPRGTRLISESPTIVLPDHADPPDLYRLVENLPDERAAAFWDLAAFKRRHDDVHWIPMIRQAYTGTSSDFDTYCDRVIHAWRIYETNRFTVRSPPHGTRDKLGLFPLAARFNHSCSPNVFHRHNHRINRLTIHALHDIPAGTELCTSYIDIVHPTPDRRRILRHWGFKCACPLCRDPSSSSEHRRAKLETLFTRVKLAAASRAARADVQQWDQARALGEVEDVLALMREEGLDEPDTRAEALALAVEAACALGWRGMALPWAEEALEIERMALGEDAEEVEVARERVERVRTMVE